MPPAQDVSHIALFRASGNTNHGRRRLLPPSPRRNPLLQAHRRLRLPPFPVSNGTTLFYESLAPYLAPHFRVLLYDRRGYHRSRTDNRPSKEEMYITHASDVAALIRHVSSSPAECDTEPAFVFTSSASSDVATELLLNHPHLVHAIVLHGPALTPLIRRTRRQNQTERNRYSIKGTFKRPPRRKRHNKLPPVHRRRTAALQSVSCLRGRFLLFSDWLIWSTISLPKSPRRGIICLI